ncbi:Calx-beta domain-containing protein, partial [Microseira wollei]|uniref:Calx-beta domain-containing protein n=1 Tax=Microseira wollei TaxID=467598 RepID=UPI0027D9BA66
MDGFETLTQRGTIGNFGIGENDREILSFEPLSLHMEQKRLGFSTPRTSIDSSLHLKQYREAAAFSDRYQFEHSWENWQSDSNDPVTGIVEGEMPTLQAALQTAENLLKTFANEPDLIANMQIAFGDSLDGNKTAFLAESWRNGDLGILPGIEVRSQFDLAGANGAFAAATNTIYLAQEFVEKNNGNVKAVASVFLEEYGHYIDSQINTTDAAGDEGEIFSDLIQGKQLTLPELSQLQTEDDSVVLVLDGRVVAIEQAEMTTQKDTLDFFAGKIVNWGGIGSNRIQTDLFKPILINPQGGIVDNLFVKFDWDLQSELKGSVFVTPGNYGEANFKYPIDLTVELPKDIDLGETFSIIPGVGVKTSEANFTEKTKGFELPNAGFELEANLNKVTFKDVTIKNPFGSDFKPDIGIESSGGQAKLSFDVIKYPSGKFDFPDGTGSISASTPKIKDGEIKPKTPRDSSDPLLPDIAASGRSDSFVKLEGDLDRIFALSFPALRVLGNEVEASLPQERISAKLSYDLLDIKANIGLGLQQDFTFDPDRVEVTMSVDGQSEQKGALGDPNNKFEFKAPSEGSGTVKVKAKYELFGNVKNNIGPVIQGGIDVSALQAGASFEIGKLSGSSQFGPLLSLKIPEDGFATDPLPLIGSPPTKPSDPDPKLKILKTINTKEIEGAEQDDKNPDQNAPKNLIVEIEYEIPYNLPFSISDARATEGNNLVFTVSRREPSNEAVNLIVEYEKGTATAGEDYFPGQRTVTIPAGQISADITVPTTGDTQNEGTETFTVKLKKQDGSSFATKDTVTTIDATGIIIDDDEKPKKPDDGGSTYNDPRIVTIDKQYHDFQAVGEFTLVESTSGDLKIQVRQEPIGSDRLGSVAENTAVATVLGGKRIGIYRDRGLLIDGIPTNIANNDSLI